MMYYMLMWQIQPSRPEKGVSGDVPHQGHYDHKLFTFDLDNNI
jgi:hypothetical protein